MAFLSAFSFHAIYGWVPFDRLYLPEQCDSVALFAFVSQFIAGLPLIGVCGDAVRERRDGRCVSSPQQYIYICPRSFFLHAWRIVFFFFEKSRALIPSYNNPKQLSSIPLSVSIGVSTWLAKQRRRLCLLVSANNTHSNSTAQVTIDLAKEECPTSNYFGRYLPSGENFC